MRQIALLAALVAIVACQGSDDVATSATIYFALDAPLCGTVIPVQFLIDSAVVGTDTFRVNVSNPHTLSRGFTTAPGNHLLGAHVVPGYVWPDTTVSVMAGSTFTRSLPFYCS